MTTTQSPNATASRAASDVARAANRALERVRGLRLGAEFPGVLPDALDEASTTLTHAVEVITRAFEGASAAHARDLSIALTEVLAARRRAASFGRDQRRQPIVALERAVERLRAAPTCGALRTQVCGEAALACGFERVILSSVTDGTWTAIDCSSSRGVACGVDELVDVSLGDATPERLCVETCRAVIAGTGGAQAASGVAEVLGASYVVAPIVAPSGLIGLLHADHRPTDRRLDELDRTMLEEFARSFADVFERTALSERLARQRHTIAEGLKREAMEAEQLAGAELRLGPVPELLDDREGTGRTVEQQRPNVTIDELMTAREREVVELLVDGASNAEIAARLVITVGTVKSHVKRILRKLGARNRSEVIAAYLELTEPD